MPSAVWKNGYDATTTDDPQTRFERVHPLVTAAILQMAYFPINALRVGKLKSTLARWLTTRMSHNYRQARENGWIDGDGYHISLAGTPSWCVRAEQRG